MSSRSHEWKREGAGKYRHIPRIVPVERTCWVFEWSRTRVMISLDNQRDRNEGDQAAN